MSTTAPPDAFLSSTNFAAATANNISSQQTKASPFQNLNSSLLIIILILCITLLVSLSLCLLLRLLNRRCIRQFSPPSTTATTTTTPITSISNRYSGSTNNRVSPENPESSIADTLPLFSFSSIKRRSSTAAISGGDCAVCLSKFEAHDLLRLLPLCCHAFHATCIDTWLNSNHSCPLCRSPVQFSDSDIAKTIGSDRSDSFRLEIGSISRRSNTSPVDTVSLTGEHQSSYSMGSFDYVVEDESEIVISQSNRRSVCFKDSVDGSIEEQPTLAADEVAAVNNSWLRDFVDRLSRSMSSSTMSFRGSGRFFTGSSRRSEVAGVGDYDLETVRVGEEISELFGWFAG